MVTKFPKFLPAKPNAPKNREPEILTDDDGNLIGYRKNGKTLKISAAPQHPQERPGLQPDRGLGRAGLGQMLPPPTRSQWKSPMVPGPQRPEPKPAAIDDEDMGLTRPGAYTFPERKRVDPATAVTIPSREQQIGKQVISERGTRQERPESRA